MSIFGEGQFKIRHNTTEIVLAHESVIVEKSQAVQSYLRVSQRFEINYKKFGNVDNYKIVLYFPSYEVFDTIMSMNGKIVEISPHLDVPYQKKQCYMWAFYDDTVPYRDKLFIEIDGVTLNTDIKNKEFYVLDVTPENLEPAFNQNNNMRLIFSDSVDYDTANLDNIKLTYSDDVGVIDFSVLSYENIVIFKLNKMLIANKIVNITVNELVKSEDGVLIREPFSSSFTVGGYQQLVVNSVAPIDNSTDISIATDIEVEFNNDINPLTLLQNNIYLEHRFKLTTGYFDYTDDYVEIQDDISLNPVNITISLWIKLIYIDDQVFISKNYLDNAIPYDVRLVGGHVQFQFYDTTWRTVLSTAITINTEYNIVCSYDGLKLRIFINKVLSGETSYIGSLPSNTNPLWIGRYPGGHTPAGHIGYIKIWNTAIINIQDIKRIYNDLDVNPDNIVMFLKFNEISGTTINDYSGLGNHGVLYNCDISFFRILRDIEIVSCVLTVSPLSNKVVVMSPNFFLYSGEQYRLVINPGLRDISNGQLLTNFYSDFMTMSYNYGFFCGYYDGQNDYAISNSQIFSGLIDSSSITFMAKIKPSEFKNGSEIFSLGSQYSMTLNTGGFITIKSGSNSIISTGRLIVGNIYFVAVSKLSTVHTVFIFNESGVLISSANAIYSISGEWNNTSFLKIGAGTFYRGMIGFVNLYSTYKTEYQLTSIISGSADVDNLERRYMHDDGSGTILHDVSVNNENALLENINELSFWRDFTQ